MGLLDFASRVTTTYRADVKDHIAELGKLKGAEKEHAKAMLDSQKSINDGLENQIKVLGKVALAAGAAAGVAMVAWDGFKDSLEHSRLVATSAGADVDRLRVASHGLKTEMELLRDAARMQSGAFKLSQEQMETAERAMLAFQRRGIETAKSQDVVLQAVTALKVDGLKDLGVFVDTAGLSMEKAEDRAKIFAKTMEVLASVSRDVKDGQNTAAEAVMATTTSLADSWSKLKRSLGELVVAMEPLLSALAKAVGLVATIASVASGNGGSEAWAITDEQKASRSRAIAAGAQALQDRAASDLAMRTNTLTGKVYNSRAEMVADAENQQMVAAQRSISSQSTVTLKDLDERSKREHAAMDAASKAASDPAVIGALAAARAKMLLSNAIIVQSGGSPATQGLGERASETQTDWAGRPIGFSLQGLYKEQEGERLTSSWNERLATNKKQTSRLSEMFGPLEEFNAYKLGFEALAGAVGSAMTAWIDGSMSAGKAFKAFIGDAVKGLAVQMAVESIKYGAYALGSLVPGPFFNPGAAAGYAKTAAAFAVGAVVAGGLAKGLGGGGASAGTGVGGGPASVTGPRGSAGSGGGNTYVVTYGAQDSDDSPYMRQRNAKKAISRVLGSPGVY